jgi:hypothetical protein
MRQSGEVHDALDAMLQEHGFDQFRLQEIGLDKCRRFMNGAAMSAKQVVDDDNLMS